MDILDLAELQSTYQLQSHLLHQHGYQDTPVLYKYHIESQLEAGVLIIRDRKSMYSVSIGRACNKADVKAFIRILTVKKHYAKVIHHSYAVVVKKDNALFQVKFNDGETDAGIVVLRILKKRNASKHDHPCCKMVWRNQAPRILDFIILKILRGMLSNKCKKKTLCKKPSSFVLRFFFVIVHLRSFFRYS